MINNKIKYKKIIAKEIILFFIGLGLVILIWVFLLFRNYYYQNRKKTYSENLSSLTIQLDSLPTDNLKSLYNKVNKYFVVNYQNGQEKYSITKKEQSNFLNYYSKSNIKLVPLPFCSKGYSFYKFSDRDSTLVFDYIDFDSFQELIKSRDYRNNLFSTFSTSNKYNIELKNGEVNIADLYDENGELIPDFLRKKKPKFNPFQPYNERFNLGTAKEFENYIQKSIKYNDSTEITKSNLTNEMISISNKIESTSLDIWDNSEIFHFLVIAALINLALLYPVRLSYKLIRWAFNALKT